MARLELEDFLDQEVRRVYLAGRLSEAKRVERTLTGNGIDYAVWDPETDREITKRYSAEEVAKMHHRKKDDGQHYPNK